MKQILVLAVILVGCARGPGRPTVRGADLYAHAAELRSHGRAVVPSSQQPVVVREGQYLVDYSRDQIFEVSQVVAGCGLGDETRCTLLLMLDQRFVVVDEAPRPRDASARAELSAVNKGRIVLAVATAAMIAGAVECDAFDGCGTLLGIGAALPGFLLLVSYTGLH